jgi:hypothetical protein
VETPPLTWRSATEFREPPRRYMKLELTESSCRSASMGRPGFVDIDRPRLSCFESHWLTTSKVARK